MTFLGFQTLLHAKVAVEMRTLSASG